MRWKYLQTIAPQKFRRATGVEMETFGQLVELLEADRSARKIPGRPPKLSIEDQVLIFLRHIRRNDVYFDIGIDYELEESTVFKIIDRVEKIIYKHPDYQCLSAQIVAEKEVDSEAPGVEEESKVDSEAPGVEEESKVESEAPGVEGESEVESEAPGVEGESEVESEEPSVYIVDATETEIIRAEDNEQQELDYSGKKKDTR